MALKPTVYKVVLGVADLDRGQSRSSRSGGTFRLRRNQLRPE